MATKRKVRDTYTTGVFLKDEDSTWAKLVINALDRKKFQPGDQVRVTVTLLNRRKP